MIGTADNPTYDVLVIGGGINGCGVARDAVGRGYSVLLAEMNDLASGTSSWSTKLIHGGLRYLEYYHFGLVRKALIEREVLWSAAPHIIWPLRFVLPYQPGLRPRWLLRLGLFLYDHLGGRKNLPPTATLDLRRHAAGKPLKNGFDTTFEYSDCWVDDARLVVLNARDAADRGAVIRTHTEVTAITREEGVWRAVLQPAGGGPPETATARLVVNAAGPWVDRVLGGVADVKTPKNVRLVKGSHIVVPRLYDHDRCYIFQNADGRIVFAIPYEDDFTMIGTTDLDYEGDPGDAAISTEETEYLCAAAGEYFVHCIDPDEVVWSFSGVRPLFDDGASSAKDATRDYVVRRDGDAKTGAIINVFGGKITTYRKLAEEILEQIEELLGARQPGWTASAPLPGGDFPVTGAAGLHAELMSEYPFLDEAYVVRLLRTYGTRTRAILSDAYSIGDLGQHFGADLYEAEISYLIDHEWAMTAQDILWRRTKRGLHLSEAEAAEVALFIEPPDAPARQKPFG